MPENYFIKNKKYSEKTLHIIEKYYKVMQGSISQPKMHMATSWTEQITFPIIDVLLEKHPRPWKVVMENNRYIIRAADGTLIVAYPTPVHAQAIMDYIAMIEKREAEKATGT